MPVEEDVEGVEIGGHARVKHAVEETESIFHAAFLAEATDDCGKGDDAGGGYVVEQQAQGSGVVALAAAGVEEDVLRDGARLSPASEHVRV